MENNYSQPGETGLADELNEYYQYEEATPLQRFLNYLIDNLFMYLALSRLTGYRWDIYLQQ